MNKNIIKKILSVLMITVSVAAATLMVSCSSDKAADASSVSSTSSGSQVNAQHSFTFTVEFANGSQKSYDISTDEKYVGAALLNEGLISGDESEHGLYVKTVAGETHDYDSDKSYWSFYIGDEYANTGVDTTEIVDGTTYKFAVGQ